MKREMMVSALAALFLSVSPVPGSATTLCEGFLPHNDLSIPADSKNAAGINQGQFNTVLDTLQELYAPEVAERGGVLEIRRLWADATVNASAQQIGNRFVINMYGGLARHEAITMDGFALVACHEMGHHLGGAPRMSGAWATNEGQADYYASLKCLRRVFSAAASSGFNRSTAGDEAAEKGCEQQFLSAADRALCVRSALAGKSLSALLMALRKETVAPRFDTPDTTVVAAMKDSHPETQCRLDTYLQGSLCTQPVSAGLSDTSTTAGACTRSGGFSTGFRPLCWYKPSPNELLPPAYIAEAVGVDSGMDYSAPVFSALRSGNPWPGF